MWFERSRVSGWGVSSESAVDERQWHWGYAGPHLYCQWGSVWTGPNGSCLFVCVCVVQVNPTFFGPQEENRL